MLTKTDKLLATEVKIEIQMISLIQCESGLIESPLSKINFLISLAWAKGGRDVGDPMLKIEKWREGGRGPPTPRKSENKLRVIWLSMRIDSHCTSNDVTELILFEIHVLNKTRRKPSLNFNFIFVIY